MKSKSWWERFKRGLDADEIFAYETQQDLNVLDRRLGQIFYLSFFIIFLYIVVYNFGIMQKYVVSVE